MITSNSNSKIIEIRKLHDAKFRKLTGLFLAEGLKAVGQAMDSGALIKTLIFAEELLVSDFGRDLVHKSKTQGRIESLEVSSSVFESLARKEKPQGIAAVIQQKWSNFADFIPVASGIIVAVDSVQNPGNLGTIIRTCDAVGAKALILLNQSTDPYDPAAVKASMGSIFSLPIIRSTSDEFSVWVNANQLSLIGTSDKALQSCFSFHFPSPCIILVGSEREGLPAELIERTTEMVSIPMEGTADSLNISVATGIILYQAYLSQKTTQGK